MTSDAVLAFEQQQINTGIAGNVNSIEKKLTTQEAVNNDDIYPNDTICRSCGAYYSINAKFCHKCGLKIGAPPNSKKASIDPQPLEVSSSPANQTKNRHARKRTRWTYAYYATAYFIVNIILILTGLFNTRWLFYGWPLVGVCYFFGLFSTGCIAVSLLTADLKVWKANRDNNPSIRLFVNIWCFSYQWTAATLIKLWMLSIVLRLVFGIVVSLPAGSYFLPFISVACVVAEIAFLSDWKLYYLASYFNGVFGLYYNPWYFVIANLVLQSLFCLLVIFGHFYFHYDDCIYQPQRTANICYDWIPYELLLLVYLPIVMYFCFYCFSNRPLHNNQVSKRFLSALRCGTLVMFIAIVMIIAEFADGHWYVYDIAGFFYLWFVIPMFWALLTKFKIKE